MALVPIKTSVGTGYCDCVHGCYELAALRDEETGRGYCRSCAEQHLELNHEVVQRIPKREETAQSFSPLPPGALPPALQKRR